MEKEGYLYDDGNKWSKIELISKKFDLWISSLMSPYVCNFSLTIIFREG